MYQAPDTSVASMEVGQPDGGVPMPGARGIFMRASLSYMAWLSPRPPASSFCVSLEDTEVVVSIPFLWEEPGSSNCGTCGFYTLQSLLVFFLLWLDCPHDCLAS